MSVYSTRHISRKEAIELLMTVWKMPDQLTNAELEQELFDKIGADWNEASPLNNYNVTDL